MNDSPPNNSYTEQLTPAEIDARHARHLLERALAQLERGERAAAMLACKQAIHLAPASSHAHSLAGLLALLNQDLKAATAAYKKSTEIFGAGSTEGERLILLQRAQMNGASLDVAALLPNLSSEILRLRQAIHAAPLASFLNASTPAATPSTPADTPAIAEAKPVDFDLPADWEKGARAERRIGKFPLRFEGRKSTSLAIIVMSALIAALLSFLIVRAVRDRAATNAPPVASNPSAPPSDATTVSDGAGSAPDNANSNPPVVSNELAPKPGGVTNNSPLPVAPPARSTPSSPTATPRAAPTSPSRPTPARLTPTRPSLPEPSLPPRVEKPVEKPSTPGAAPPARSVPAEPMFPPMPPPRVILPQPDPAAAPKPDSGGDDGDHAGPRFSTP